MRAIAASAPRATGLFERPGISVKLTALHPRFEAVSRERVLAELTPRVLERAYDLGSLHAAGVDGERQYVAVLSLGAVADADVAALPSSVSSKPGRRRGRSK